MTATETLRGELKKGEPMAAHVSWRAGGLARIAYTPADLADLSAFLRQLRTDEPVLFVGLGSNLLVRDGGFDGTVIFTHWALRGLELQADGRIYAGAGEASPKLARFGANHDLVGAEFLAGVPGTIGGALAMNAGCYGGETWGLVDAVQTIDRSGVVRVRPREDFKIGYRHVGLKGVTDEWFVGAWFRLARGDGAAAREHIRGLLQKRIDSQPLQLPNAGSVFRNPPEDFAARLIETSGLKGVTIGGAQVSEKHANFIVNPGGAGSAGDIERLIRQVRETVEQRHGVRLVQEVRIVGEAQQERESLR